MNVDEIFCYLLVAMATRHPDGENCINMVFLIGSVMSSVCK